MHARNKTYLIKGEEVLPRAREAEPRRRLLRPCVLVADEYGLHLSYTDCSSVVIALSLLW